MSFQVEPKEIIQISNVEYLRISINQISLDDYANIIVTFLDKNSSVIKSEGFCLTKPDYDLWVSDEWLYDYVCNKYGLVRK